MSVLTDGTSAPITDGAGLPLLVEEPGLIGFMPFLAVQVTAYRPGVSTFTAADATGTFPVGAIAEISDVLEAAPAMLLASDIGYRTSTGDAGGVVTYPPYLDQAFQISTGLNLDPSQSGVAASWGSVLLINADRRWDSIAADWNSDGRTITVLAGNKISDVSRQYWMDPPYANLTNLFSGLSAQWFLSDTALEIPIRDATYWLDRPLQQYLYLGTGTYEGPTVLTGKPKPIARGGTTADPIRNVTPTLVDPTNRIYQYNDAAGTVVNLYEGAATVFTFDSNTTNLYAGSTPAGKYRTDNSRGLFQLGSAPVHTITADVTGQFAVAGAVTTAALIARYLLSEGVALPAANIDTASFTAADTAYPYTAGVFWGSDVTPSGVDALSFLLSSFGGQLVPLRNGQLRLIVLGPVSAMAMAAATWDMTEIVSIVPMALPSALAPPPYRFRIRYAENHTMQSSDVNAATATAAQQQFVAGTGPVAVWTSAANLTAYRRPNDTPEIGGALLKLADAQAVADSRGALWGSRRRLYAVAVRPSTGLARDFADIVSLAFPIDDLTNGRAGQIVGFDFSSKDNVATFKVLV